MSEPLLSVSDLIISSDEKILVDGISFDIRKGTSHGIVGESGSGKTLSALSLLQLLPPGIQINSGCARLASERTADNIYALREEEMNTIRGREIAMIFQEPMTSLNPTLRCGRQVEEGILLHKKTEKKEAREQVLDLFEEVKLPDPLRAYNAWPHQLSGGQRQRIMIAMALAMKPSLLIADEPTTALDVTVQKKILQLLRELQLKHQLSILFISHDLMVVKELAHEVSVMYKGKIVEQGDSNLVFSSPSSSYTKGLLACKPGQDAPPHRLPTVPDFMNGKIPEQPPVRKKISKNAGVPLLEIRNLSTHYYSGQKRKGPVKAVDNVNLVLYPGETLGLVGESGCGKTTLGRTILQLVEASSGDVLYRGLELNRLKARMLRKVRKHMQIVFQDPYSSLNPRMTIGHMLTEPMRIHGTGKSSKERYEKAAILMKKVGLAREDLDRYPHQFSGGQRQRIGIARALATEPEFIILDESVSALDVSIQAQVLNLLNDLKDEFGLTYIFISHDLSVVRYMSDRVVVMQAGKIIEEGDSRQIFTTPKQDYTRELLDAIPG